MSNVGPNLPTNSVSYQGGVAPGVESAILSLAMIFNIVGEDMFKQGLINMLSENKAGRAQAQEQKSAGVEEAWGAGIKGATELLGGSIQAGGGIYGMSAGSNFTAPGEEELNNAKANLDIVNKALNNPEVELTDATTWAAKDPAEKLDESKGAIQEILDGKNFGKSFDQDETNAVNTAPKEELEQLKSSLEGYITDQSKTVSSAHEHNYNTKVRPKVEISVAFGRISDAVGSMAKAPIDGVAASNRATSTVDETTKGAAQTLSNQMYQRGMSSFNDVSQIISALSEISQGGFARA